MKNFDKYQFMAAGLVLCLHAGADAATLSGNATAGQRLAQQCADCHGSDGIAPDETMPNLAGQKAGYLIKQLGDMRSTANKRAGLTLTQDIDKEIRNSRYKFTRVGRSNEIMDSVVIDLRDRDIADLAAHYSNLPCATTRALTVPKPPVQAARCKACHGANGISRSSVIPNLAGQSEGYLINRLESYREIGRTLSKKERRRNIGTAAA